MSPCYVNQKLENHCQKEVISRCVVLILDVRNDSATWRDTVYYKDCDLLKVDTCC
jgi:hypothetical protein